MIDKKQIRKDKWLQRLMKTGLPLAVVSIASLWIGHFSTSEVFGKVFLVTMPLALVIGFAYNIRYVMLSIREQKKQSTIK
jgi:hypothetical protein